MLPWFQGFLSGVRRVFFDGTEQPQLSGIDFVGFDSTYDEDAGKYIITTPSNFSSATSHAVPSTLVERNNLGASAFRGVQVNTSADLMSVIINGDARSITMYDSSNVVRIELDGDIGWISGTEVKAQKIDAREGEDEDLIIGGEAGTTKDVLIGQAANEIKLKGTSTIEQVARFLKQINVQWKEITYAAAITPNLADGMIQYVKLTGNIGINPPSELVATPGVTEQGIYVLILEQDSTGNRIVDWGNGAPEYYQFVTDTGTLSTAGSALDVFVFLALPTKANTPTMLCLLAKKGFTTDN